MEGGAAQDDSLQYRGNGGHSVICKYDGTAEGRNNLTH